MSKLSSFSPFQLKANCLPSGENAGHSSRPGKLVKGIDLIGSSEDLGLVRKKLNQTTPPTANATTMAVGHIIPRGLITRFLARSPISSSQRGLPDAPCSCSINSAPSPTDAILATKR